MGFAAETENRMENGRAKLLRKGADAIVVNDVAGEGVGIDADNNAATFLTTSTAIEMPQMPKRKLADRILDEILTLRRPRPLMVELRCVKQTLREPASPSRTACSKKASPWLPLAAAADRGVSAVARPLDPATARGSGRAHALLSRPGADRVLSAAGRLGWCWMRAAVDVEQAAANAAEIAGRASRQLPQDRLHDRNQLSGEEAAIPPRKSLSRPAADRRRCCARRTRRRTRS